MMQFLETLGYISDGVSVIVNGVNTYADNYFV